jgi:hypothetical protein
MPLRPHFSKNDTAAKCASNVGENRGHQVNLEATLLPEHVKGIANQ